MSKLQPDYSPQLTNHPSSPVSPIPPNPRPKTRHPSSIKSVLGIALLSVIIAGGLLFANKYIQNQTSTAPKAALSQTVDLRLERVGTDTIYPNGTFDVNVVINDTGTNNQKVAALDMSFTTQNLEITNFQAGNFFSTVGKHPANGPNLTAIELKRDIATKRFALGAACDKCCVGSTCTDPNNSQITYEACSPQATCYAKVANGQVVATLTVKALAAGQASLAFDSTKTQIAVLDGSATPPQTSAHRNLTALNLNIGGSGETTACELYNIAPVGDLDQVINGSDIQQVANAWNTQQGNAGFVPGYDFAPPGSPDGNIQGADIQQVANHWNTQCN